jgi:enamine deaminase RidA (YjgF/YER057c/UK114 family)
MTANPLTHIHPSTVHSELGAWTHAVETEAGPGRRFVFLSGQTSVDRAAHVVGAGDLEAQFHQVYGNLQRVIEACGGGLDDIVSMRTYLTRREDVPRFRVLRDRVHRELFPRGNYPAHTLVLVSGLALDELLIEVEAVVLITP